MAAGAFAGLGFALFSGGEFRLPAWAILPFLGALLLPNTLQFMIHARKTKFTVPVPEPDDPERTRGSRHVFFIILAFLFVAALAFGLTAVRLHTNAVAFELATVLLPSLAFLFTLLPWIRIYRWLRKVEDGLLARQRPARPDDSDPSGRSGGQP